MTLNEKRIIKFGLILSYLFTVSLSSQTIEMDDQTINLRLQKSGYTPVEERFYEEFGKHTMSLIPVGNIIYTKVHRDKVIENIKGENIHHFISKLEKEGRIHYER